jgi:hypothetical protein
VSRGQEPGRLTLKGLDMATQRLRVLSAKGNRQRVVRVRDEVIAAPKDSIASFMRPGFIPLLVTDDAALMSDNTVRVVPMWLGENQTVLRFFPSVKSHLWHLGCRARSKRARYAVPAGPPDPGHGEALLSHLSARGEDNSAQADARWSPAPILASEIGLCQGAELGL